MTLVLPIQGAQHSVLGISGLCKQLQLVVSLHHCNTSWPRFKLNANVLHVTMGKITYGYLKATPGEFRDL